MEGRAVRGAISRCLSFFRTANNVTWTADFFKIPVPFEFGGHGNTNNICTIPVPCGPGKSIDKTGLKPFLKAKYIPMFSTFASAGSSLFSLGGRDNCSDLPVSKIYRLDRTFAAVGEDDFVGTMLCPRMGHDVVEMDGKLYSMGGLTLDSESLWGECFDPSTNKSSPLPSPPFDQLLKWEGDARVVAPLHSSKKIFVAPLSPSSEPAFFYHVKDETWEELDHRVDFSTVFGEAAVLQNSTTLCWIGGQKLEIHAYDLDLKKWFISPIEGLDKVGTVPESDEVVNICSLFRLDDNHLCLLWQDYLDFPHGPTFGLLHCIEVEVEISKCSQGEFKLKAFVVSSQSYVIEPGATLFKGLAL
ncbi:hypothetical protein Vadar_015697 [Vaccinium darrowii]|uniref:Uncharacterized protein n=1 Tax=Vaccinium darrowii TaxID=229202 RepID=A0ACB7XQY5_9ERIC|nr:hypothetical protein Vadar_015697 [Vaccinium darrowii]